MTHDIVTGYDLRASLKDLLSVVMDLGQFGPNSSSVILLYDEATQELRMGTRCGKLQDVPCFYGAVEADKRWCGRALWEGQIVYPARQLYEGDAATPLNKCGKPGDICVPLLIDGRPVGVLGLWIEGEVSPAALDFLHLIAHYLAEAVDRARMHDQAQRRSDEMLLLIRTGQLITSTLELEEVLSVIVTEARAVLRAEGVWLLLLDEAGEQLILEAASGSDAERVEGLRLPKKAGVAGWVLEAQQPALVGDVATDPRFYREIDAYRGSQTGSLVAAPVTCKGRLLGVLEAVCGTPGTFRPQDVDLLEVLAGYAAIAIENAHLYEAERELRKAVTESQAQLAQGNRLASVGRITASLAHELNNPLQALHNSLQVILSFPLEETEKDAYIGMADEEVTRLIEMVNRILEFSRRPGVEMRPINLNAVVQRVMDLTHKYLQHHHVVLDSYLQPQLPEVVGNPGRLGQVLLNLIINAVEVMPQGGMLSVTTEGPQEGYVKLCVADTGPGISPEVLSHLFEPFFTTKKQGTGLGLSISQNIIVQHGGRISVQSVVGVGSSFEVRLPLSPGDNGADEGV